LTVENFPVKQRWKVKLLVAPVFVHWICITGKPGARWKNRRWEMSQSDSHTHQSPKQEWFQRACLWLLWGFCTETLVVVLEFVTDVTVYSFVNFFVRFVPRLRMGMIRHSKTVNF